MKNFEFLTNDELKEIRGGNDQSGVGASIGSGSEVKNDGVGASLGAPSKPTDLGSKGGFTIGRLGTG